jgi:PAS domain S-box-containing protein
MHNAFPDFDPSPKLKVSPDFLAEGGEAGELMRALDWTKSPLGCPAEWPQSLQTVVSLLLTSKFPMFVAWGPELCFLYNDDYAPILGAKHPAAMGRPFADVWFEIWEDIGPLIKRALAGEATYHENLPLLMLRKGFEEQTYFTFSYSPVRDASGRVAGMFCACTETTEKVLNERRLAFQVEFGDRLRGISDPQTVQMTAAEVLGRHLQVARAGYGEIDAAGEVVTVQRDWSDGTLDSLAGEARLLDGFGPAIVAELRAGRTLRVQDCRTDPRSMGKAHAATWESINTRALIVVPLIRNGRLKAVFYLHEPEPRRWTQAEIALAEDVAERTWDAVERARTEEDLRESEGRLRLAIDAGRMAVWEWSAATGSIKGSPELNRMLGFPRGYQLRTEDAEARYFPGEYARVQAAGRDAVVRGEPYFEVEFHYGWPDGPYRWFLLRAEIILDAAGVPSNVIGVLLDITDRRQAEEALRQRESELKDALSAASLATYVFDHRTGTLKSSGLNKMYGYPEDADLTLDDVRARYHPDDFARISQVLSAAADPSVNQLEMDFRLLLPGGIVRWVYSKGEYVRDAAGEPLFSRGVVMDVSDRKRWEEHQQLLINELNHRVKNTLATVQSIATQTLRNAPTMKAASEALESRIFALSRAHDVLTRENWEGARLYEIVAQTVAPYSSQGEDRLHISGPDVKLSPRMALALAMALQELATNAVKYGALSNAAGEVTISWALRHEADRPRLNLTWKEAGGPPVVPPTRRGFGSRLIERSLAHDLDGDVSIAFDPAGIVCTVDAPI